MRMERWRKAGTMRLRAGHSLLRRGHHPHRRAADVRSFDRDCLRGSCTPHVSPVTIGGDADAHTVARRIAWSQANSPHSEESVVGSCTRAAYLCRSRPTRSALVNTSRVAAASRSAQCRFVRVTVRGRPRTFPRNKLTRPRSDFGMAKIVSKYRLMTRVAVIGLNHRATPEMPPAPLPASLPRARACRGLPECPPSPSSPSSSPVAAGTPLGDARRG